MALINVNQLSSQLKSLIYDKIIDGRVDAAELEGLKARGRISAEVLSEIDMLLQNSLNGGKAFGDIGDTILISQHSAEKSRTILPEYHDLFKIDENYNVDEVIFTQEYWDSVAKEHNGVLLSLEERESKWVIAWKDIDAGAVHSFVFEKASGSIGYNVDKNSRTAENFQYVMMNGKKPYIDYIKYDSSDKNKYERRIVENGIEVYSESDGKKYEKIGSIEIYSDKSGNNDEKRIVRNGIEIYSEINGNKKFNTADILIEKLHNKKFFEKLDKNEIEELVKGIDDILIENGILNYYYDKTGKNLEEELYNNKNLRNSVYKELCYKIMGNRSQAVVNYIKNDIERNIKEKNTDDLKRDFNNLLSDYNLDRVLKAFKDGDNSEKMSPDKIAEEMGDSYVATLSDEYLENKVEPAIGLISLIDKSKLPTDEKKYFIGELLSDKYQYIRSKQTIADVFNVDVNQYIKGRYTDDILSDMKEHKIDTNIVVPTDQDIQIYKTDLLRLFNRKHVNKITIKKRIELNGEFDSKIGQGRTGDCWLLAGLISIAEREKMNGESSILSNIVKREENGDYTVTLHGDDGEYQYTMSYQDIKNSIHLSRGDGDVRAIEIAVDQYIKEQSYADMHTDRVDINGNNESVLYKLILGNGETACYEKGKYDFNDPNMAYAFSVGDEVAVESLTGSALKGKLRVITVDIHKHHAYAITGSDDKYVYMINPWDSSEKLCIKWEKFEKMNPNISVAKLK